jgi:dynein intermediate chain 1
MKRKEEADAHRQHALENASAEAGEEIDPNEIDGQDVKNQFNFSDRAAQTFNNPLKEIAVETKPPAVDTFNGTLSQWDIYDYYMRSSVVKLHIFLYFTFYRYSLVGF